MFYSENSKLFNTLIFSLQSPNTFQDKLKTNCHCAQQAARVVEKNNNINSNNKTTNTYFFQQLISMF